MNKLLTLILLFSAVFGIAQDSTYYRIYGGLLNETAADIAVGPNDDYFILGTTGSNENYDSQFYLIRTDDQMDPIWTKHMGGNQSDRAEAILPHAEGGFLLLGSTHEGNDYNVLVIKVDENGEEEWSSTYGGEDWEFAYNMIAHPDGGYLIVGETYSYGNGENDVYLIYIDENGEEIWSAAYGGVENDYGKDIIIVNDDHIAIGGSSNSFNDLDTYQAGLFRVDFEGNLLTYSFYGFGNHEVRSLVNKEDFIVLCGYYEEEGLGQQGFVTKVYNDNTISWFGPIGLSGDEWLNDFFAWEEHFYCTGAIFLEGSVDSDCYAFEGNIVASFVSATTFGDAGDDEGKRIIKDEDHTLILGTTVLEEGQNSNIFAIKMNFGDFFLDADSISYLTHFDEAVFVEEWDNSKHLGIYPNPSNDKFSLDLSLNLLGGGLYIFDSQSRVVFKETGLSSFENIEPKLDQGMYFVEYIKDDYSYSGRLILK